MTPVEKFAKDQGYWGAEFKGAYEGQAVYEILLGDPAGPVFDAGLPMYIIARGNTMRISDPEESWKLLAYFAAQASDDDDDEKPDEDQA